LCEWVWGKKYGNGRWFKICEKLVVIWVLKLLQNIFYCCAKSDIFIHGKN
jgi:hypothetical protein